MHWPVLGRLSESTERQVSVNVNKMERNDDRDDTTRKLLTADKVWVTHDKNYGKKGKREKKASKKVLVTHDYNISKVGGKGGKGKKGDKGKGKATKSKGKITKSKPKTPGKGKSFKSKAKPIKPKPTGVPGAPSAPFAGSPVPSPTPLQARTEPRAPSASATGAAAAPSVPFAPPSSPVAAPVVSSPRTQPDSPVSPYIHYDVEYENRKE